MGLKGLDLTIIQLTCAHRKLLGTRLQKRGITRGQPPVLDYLAEHNGCIQNALSRSCHLEPATITGILSTMERDGLVQRRPNPEDRRVWQVFLTEKGWEASRFLDQIREWDETVGYAGFTPEEKRQAEAFMRRITDNLMQAIQSEQEETDSE